MKQPDTEFSAALLDIDLKTEADRIGGEIRKQVRNDLRRDGAVVGLSGGIDSSATVALSVRALGPDRVFGILMPEKDSDPISLELALQLAKTLGIKSVVEDISPILSAAGCYRRRDDAIRELVPEFGDGWGCKVTIDALTNGGINITSLIVSSPDGEQRKLRMPLGIYDAIIAASNMKQRTRKQLEYYYADKLHYAVAGTPNRLEYDQGFFVKFGDGAADFKPIAHLYKTQVYRMAEFLDVPKEICSRLPTTDTWSLPQTQDEFFFSIPYPAMDLCLLAYNNAASVRATAAATGLTEPQVEAIWRDIVSKRRAAHYLHAPPLLAG